MASGPCRDSVINCVGVGIKTQVRGCKPSEVIINPVKNKHAITKSKHDLTQIQSNDFEHVCRICLLANSNMVSLMSKIGSDIVADMLYSVTTIMVVPEENLPLAVCTPCHGCLIDCYKFKMKCIESNKILQSKIGAKIDQSKKYSSNAAKIDEETLTCVDVESKIHAEEIKTVDVKFEMDFKSEHYHEEIEYLDEELFLSNESNIHVGHTPKNLLIERKNTKYVNKQQFTCHKCPRKFSKLKALRVHTEQCNKNKRNKFKCGQCPQSFNSAYDLTIHSALHVKGNKWKCIECNKEFTDRTRFRRHIRRHMDTTKRWSCVSCGKAFSERSAMRRHARVHSGEAKEKKYPCMLCDKKFGDRNQLNEHNSKHTGVRPYPCGVCSKTFASSRLLASHSRVHIDYMPYECAFCDKRFREKSTRDTHNRTHTGERPYVCSVCGKAFIQSSNLSLHMRTHTGVKPYTCKVCGRKFSAGSTLTCHMRVHTGDKPYSCNICGKRFARTDIKAHLRLHTGERPYACCACPKHFASAAGLRDHRRVHTGENLFQCTLCPAKYTKKIYLMNHLKAHANEKNVIIKNIVVRNQQAPYVVDDSETLTTIVESNECMTKNEIVTLNADEIPSQLSHELILLDDRDVNAELVVVDDEHSKCNY